MVSEPLNFVVTSFLRYELPHRRYRGPSARMQCKITVSPPGTGLLYNTGEMGAESLAGGLDGSWVGPPSGLSGPGAVVL